MQFFFVEMKKRVSISLRVGLRSMKHTIVVNIDLDIAYCVKDNSRYFSQCYKPHDFRLYYKTRIIERVF